MKLGKKPFIKDKRDLLYKNYTIAVTLPTRPKEFGHQNLISDWGVLGNDTVGDCTCAGADHETMLWTIEGGKLADFTPQNTIADYSAITGYNPSDPNTDQGAVVRDVLLYRQKTGMIDANDKRHQIGAFLALDQKNIDEVLEALYLYSAVGIGILFPQSAMNQFNTGKPWTVVIGSPIEGGHYVPIVGYDSDYIYCVTWGQIQKMDYDFFKTYCDEAWAILSKEYLNGQGLSPEGFNLDQLQADLNAITNSPIPNPMKLSYTRNQTYWYVQVGGGFLHKAKAQQLIKQLLSKGMNANFGTNTVPYRIWCGKSTNKNEIVTLQKKLTGMGYSTSLVSTQA